MIGSVGHVAFAPGFCLIGNFLLHMCESDRDARMHAHTRTHFKIKVLFFKKVCKCMQPIVSKTADDLAVCSSALLSSASWLAAPSCCIAAV